MSSCVGWSGGGAAAFALAASLVASVAGFGSAAQAQGVGSFGVGRGGPSGRGPMAFASPVSAASPGADGGGRLREYLFGSHTNERQALPKVARFRTGGGEDGFILDRSAGGALLRFEDSPEIWALSASAGPRGDMIFKNDVSDPVLRMTRLGGVTLFTDERPDGMAVALAGAAGPLSPPPSIGPNALFQALAASSVRASRAAQHLISFVVVPDATPKTDWLFADAAMVTAEAFVRLAQQGADGRSLAGRFVRVEFLTGGTVQAQASGGVVHITISPGKGVAGRPSSKKIFLVLRRR